MAVKRKRLKLLFNPVVRGKAVRLKAPHEEHEPTQPVTQNNLSLDTMPSASHSSRVMLVIFVAGLIFIGFITWCISLMPSK